ncbi:MAG: DEAD/DEAH box helicase family protein [Lachnospiraceae bacterium]|nr:DEAD/DEAH box helicase family protein [Lachnospiraceae bacterium]
MLSFREIGENKKAVQEAAKLAESLRALEGRKAELSAEITGLYKKLKDEGVRKLLKDTPPEKLKNIDPEIRLTGLEEAGIDNVAALAGKSASQLTAIKGIGEESAQKIQLATLKLKELVLSEYRFFLDAAVLGSEEKKLITAVEEYDSASAIFDEAARAASVLEHKTAQAKEYSKAGQSMFGYLVSKKESRERAKDINDELKSLLGSEQCRQWRGLKEKYRSAASAAASSACEKFSKNSAAFYTGLEYILKETGTAKKQKLGEEKLKYALPSELAEEIEKFEPDHSLMISRLRPYQEFGTRYILSRGRVLLGDDMGLGKTIQAIASIAHLKARGGKYFLVICPLSVLTNWSREIPKHSKMEVLAIYGSDRGDEFEQWIKEGGIAVTTYETVKKLELPEGMIIDMLVVDEAHYVKNRAAQRTKSVLKYADMSEYVVFMSGTPLENKVEEMNGLVEVLNPNVAAELKKPGTLSRPEIYRKTVAPVYLRRQREDVLKELPPLVESEEWCRMTDKEKECYRGALLKSRRSFMPLRYAVWKAEDSSKAERFLELWEQAMEEGRKLLVFSYFLEVLDRLRQLLSERAAFVCRIDGSVPAGERQGMIDEFESAAAGAVILSQVISGGVGLNIQSASVVVFCEPQIKPSIEDQAVARAYRMGQARSVLVYRLLTQNAIDERMMEILKTKREDFNKYAAESEVGETAQATRTDEIDTATMKQIVKEECVRYGVEPEEAAPETEVENGPAAGDRSTGEGVQ